MLNKEEEQRLASFLAATRLDLEKDITYASEYYVSAVRWLAEKLKESNDHLKSLIACSGEERHRHYDIYRNVIITHVHPHFKQRGDFEPLHHHSIFEHEDLIYDEVKATEEVTSERPF